MQILASIFYAPEQKTGGPVKPFIHDDFLLEGVRASRLYHEYAATEPVIDYHCHMDPAEIGSNVRYRDITELWLAGDHYKWRLMRAAGVDEELITGGAPPREKFRAWAAVLPRAVGNPLHHWAALELARFFGITRPLDAESADSIYDECNERLASGGFGMRDLLRKKNVDIVCTTDDPADSLEHHLAIGREHCSFRMLPAWRPDRALAVDNPVEFNAWLDRLERAVSREIRTFDDFMDGLEMSSVRFGCAGCKIADHGLAAMPEFDGPAGRSLGNIFSKARTGTAPSADQARLWRRELLLLLAGMNHRRGWAQQIHAGIERNVNGAMYARLGPDSGFDAIGGSLGARGLSAFFDALAKTGTLARTVVYPANPSDYWSVATIAGCFQEGPVPGKIQLGSAWWFLDCLEGIERQIETVAASGLLGTFIGMTTDSRSPLSFCRHEYFRRILCNMLGRGMDRGRIPGDMKLAGALVRRVCAANAREYFGFNEGGTDGSA